MRRNGHRGHTAAVLGSLLLGACAAMAQPATPELTPGERARRDAEKVFQWIRMHADTPRRGREEKPAVPPRATAKAEPVREGDRDDPVAARAEARKESKEVRAEPVRSGRDNVPAAAALASAANPTAPANPAALGGYAAAASTAAAPVAGERAASAPDEPVAPPLTGSAAQTVAAAPASAPAALAVANPASAAESAEEDDEAAGALVLAHQVEPDFPSAMVRQLHRGKVQVRFTVRPDGSVEQPEIVHSSHRRLNAPALDAVAQWRFKPVRQAKVGVVELGFSLD